MNIRAYAKINLTLDIVGRRNDGYHLIDSVFQSVGLSDVLSIEKSEKITVCCDGIKQSDNIAFTAAKEFFDFTGLKAGANIKIEKHIPLLSGLGGGSADAAAVIKALDSIYKTNLKVEQLVQIALKCGADVPFFLFGGTARVSGIGEKVAPLKPIKDFYALLIKAGEKQSTKDMYKRLDNMLTTDNYTKQFLNLAETNGYAAALGNIGNAFSAVAGDKDVILALKTQNPIGVSVSGSGPTHFAVFYDKDAAQNAKNELENRGYKPIVAPFMEFESEISD